MNQLVAFTVAGSAWCQARMNKFRRERIGN
jgi:hypothetical protein